LVKSAKDPENRQGNRSWYDKNDRARRRRYDPAYAMRVKAEAIKELGERYALEGREGIDLPDAPEWMKCGKGMRRP
jgi:hypothetical protein